MNFLQMTLRKSLGFLRWNTLLPRGDGWDWWHAHLHCLRHNGHWPRAMGGGLDDFLAFLKGSPEIALERRVLLSDKYLLKAEVERLLGPGWAIPTLGVLYNARQVMQHDFPRRCVIKPNHLSGEIIYRSDGEPVNRALMARWLRASHYHRTRERNYHPLRPVVLVEPWLAFPEGRISRIYCLRGQPQLIAMSLEKPDGSRARGAFDTQGQFLGYGMFGRYETRNSLMETAPHGIPQLTELLEAARIMAQGMVFARIDILHTNQGLMVNEVTSVPFGGASRSQPAGREGDFARQLFGPQGFNLHDYPELNPR